ncbi:MAG: type II toxin-antitoxin system HicB family antitoxin [Proteobacteria bacterium]|nr:type II toxin-antitoxin system HicB family antitoxin [Pseudomonadota bacterium]
MEMKLTAVYEKVASGYVGYVEELPGANTQGHTLEETRSNLREAIELVLEANKQLTEEDNTGKDAIKEQIGSLMI